MASRLVDEQPTHVIEVGGGEAPLIEDRRALERSDTVGDDPKGLAGRVVVDRPGDGRRYSITSPQTIVDSAT